VKLFMILEMDSGSFLRYFPWNFKKYSSTDINVFVRADDGVFGPLLLFPANRDLWGFVLELNIKNLGNISENR